MFDVRKLEIKKMKDLAADVGSLRKKYGRSIGRAAVKSLKKNNFEAYYADTKEEAAKLVLSLIPDGSIIGLGDSNTIYALDLDEALEEKNCVYIPNLYALNTHAQDSTGNNYVKVGNKQEMREVLMQYLVSNVFMLGANAITMDGQIVNVDGRGNRVAGSLYGPDRVIVVAGVNKLVKDLNAGLERVHFVAAHINNIKYEKEVPCTKTGLCADCRSEARGCNMTAILHRKPEESDFHVIIIGEELGF